MTTAAFTLDRLTLLVSSFERVMPFYETLLPMLGMRRKRAHVWTNDAGVFFQFGEAKPDTRAYERYGSGLNHAGFAAPDLATVEHIRETMLAAGHFASQVQSFGEHEAVFFRDLHGLRIEVGYMPPGIDPVDKASGPASVAAGRCPLSCFAGEGQARSARVRVCGQS